MFNDVDKVGADHVDFWSLGAPLTSICFLSHAHWSLISKYMYIIDLCLLKQRWPSYIQ